jgi:stage II sporulation protein D
LGALILLAACAAPLSYAPPVSHAAQMKMTLPSTIRVSVAGRVVAVPLEDYVLGSALSEVAPVGDSGTTVDRIFEVQAIIARTYAVAHLGRHAAQGFDLCDGTHCQLYQPGRLATSRFAPAARAAVTRTAHEILTYEGRPAEALFHSDCGGHTAPADTVWGGSPVPYLVGAPDDVPGDVHRHWQFEVTTAALRQALNADPRSAIGARLDGLVILGHDSSGRVEQLELKGQHTQIVRAEQLRAIVNARLGDRALQSTRFIIRHVGTTWTFSGTGFGHGVGLCQVGAAARARRGDGLQAILSSYFPGARLQTAG